jgi:hypothetical protein
MKVNLFLLLSASLCRDEVLAQQKQDPNYHHVIRRLKKNKKKLPSLMPSQPPSTEPSEEPSNPSSSEPSSNPTTSNAPSTLPSLMPSQPPSTEPSEEPSSSPSSAPSAAPSSGPSMTPSQTPPPLKIIIMTGQSNMQGHAHIAHLDALIQGTLDTPSLDDLAETTAYLQHLQDGSGSWSQRDDVYITYHSANSLTSNFEIVEQGQLTMSTGYGKDKTKFGPEVGFGWKLGDLLANDQEVFIIKVGWGGASLAQDFRPPSRRTNIPDYNEPTEGFGWAFDAVVTHVNDTLANIGNMNLPNYDPIVGHELVGLVFFQGFNDVLNWGTVNEYKDNLFSFVSDMRNKLGTSDLKVVIGEVGMHGPLDPNCPTQIAGLCPFEPACDCSQECAPFPSHCQRVSTLRKAQRTVANTVVGVRLAETGIYNYGHISGQVTWGSQGYHYYNNADTMYYIGESMGNAMYEVMNTLEI